MATREEELRLAALDRAIELRGRHASPDAVLATAKRFAAFLSGEPTSATAGDEDPP